MRALLVFGARPNYMKIAPLYRAMRQDSDCEPVLVNTGQHFDKSMSDAFVDALGLPEADIELRVGPGSQAQQMARIMQSLESVLLATKPDVTVVVGDVSSTLAAALVSSTVGVPVAHVEAGLRSNDWNMPEERNRVLTDRLSQYLFTPSADGDENLKAEGIDPSKIFCVGNVMIDTLDWVLPRLPRAATRKKYNITEREFALVTLHRPSNVDDPAVLPEIIRALNDISQRLPLYFPLHPRTRKRLDEFGIKIDPKRITTLPPLDYLEFISLLSESSLVLSDSGGIQEETTVLGVPCLTLRENTERPITLKYGRNELVKSEYQAIIAAADRNLSQGKGEPQRPPLWDGRAAQRTVEALCNQLVPHRSPRACVPAHKMNHSFAAVVLAGGIRRSPLVEATGMPALCLPLSRRTTLLGTWLDSLQAAGQCQSVTIVVSTERDAQTIENHIAEIEQWHPHDFPVLVTLEPARWRGTGGIVRDVAASMIEGDRVLLVEGTCLPAPRLDLLINALDEKTIAAVGVDQKREPAGTYAVHRDALRHVPAVGYFDIKEQLLPSLYDEGLGAKAVEVVQRVIRLRSRTGYLQAVAALQERMEQTRASRRPMISNGSLIDSRIVGSCLIARGATVEADAIIHDSVVLDGAIVRRGAVVSRSVIGPGVEIGNGRIVSDAMEAAEISNSDQKQYEADSLQADSRSR